MGLEMMEELWIDGAESETEDHILLDETHLQIQLRNGHSLRVVLANVGLGTILELYTLSENGMIVSY